MSAVKDLADLALHAPACLRRLSESRTQKVDAPTVVFPHPDNDGRSVRKTAQLPILPTFGARPASADTTAEWAVQARTLPAQGSSNDLSTES